MLLSIILIKCHLEISGNDNNEEHPLKILFIFTKFLIFHFEILGKDCNDKQFINIPSAN